MIETLRLIDHLSFRSSPHECGDAYDVLSEASRYAKHLLNTNEILRNYKSNFDRLANFSEQRDMEELHNFIFHPTFPQVMETCNAYDGHNLCGTTSSPHGRLLDAVTAQTSIQWHRRVVERKCPVLCLHLCKVLYSNRTILPS
jgi:hypothetical protein